LNQDDDGEMEMAHNNVAGITLSALRFLGRDMQDVMAPELHLRSDVKQ
jgi:hypothetical protein